MISNTELLIYMKKKTDVDIWKEENEYFGLVGQIGMKCQLKEQMDKFW